ncbi:UPF0182 family protein [Thermospira aquatica]|uniref:UPF0182 family protein n=1 Tax=Thermospira aquatica TaxID=2828656 RepID=A0AAX3BEV7_9SPIR|nr:UPF0182 family protein [Thermospira aquatica]URA10653.1 UPF0182 family protein [Thermospira aquatica]
MKHWWLWILIVILLAGMTTGLLWFIFPSLTMYWWYQDLGVSPMLWRRFAWDALWILGAFWFPWLGLWFWFGLIRQRWGGGFVLLALFLGILSSILVWWQRENTLSILVSPSGIQDSLLHLDTMWYVAWLPFWRKVALYLTVFVGILLTVDIFVSTTSTQKRDWQRLILVFLLLSGGITIAMLFSFELFVWQPNKRLGIGFSDFYGTLVAWWCVVGVGTGLVILWTLMIFLGKLQPSHFFIQLGVASLLAALVLWLWPVFLTQFYEKPNELRAQKRFIEARRKATREGFGLQYEAFHFQPTLETLSYTRLWDIQPYLQNIRQLQTIRNYFDFFDVDIDFYTISNELLQVLIACREITLTNLLPEVRNWENTHLRYTHGLGVVVSPAHEISPEGQPVFWVKNLNMETEHPEFSLKRPQIYFGESEHSYIIVRTEVKEFEYTDITNRVEKQYEGTNGVRLSTFRKLAFSRAFGEKNILLSRYLSKESGVLWKRQLSQRLQALVPQLCYDPDPYPVILDGEIFWIIDAYTTTDRYPLSDRYDSRWGRINGIRHSVKVVVSAYTGDVKYYVVDPADPLLAPLRFFARELFTEDIPDNLKAHFHYPYTLLALQAEVFCRYHMDSDESFYNGDDVWSIPLVRQWGTNLPYEPLYMLLKTTNTSLGGVFIPFTPLGRQNLSGWLFGTYENGLKLYQYVASRIESIPGPLQVDAQIYQNEELAKLFTLWGQRNSQVSLGMTRYLPLTGGVIALVPLYISSEYNPIPQVALIIAVYNNKVHYAKTSDELIRILAKDMVSSTRE